MGNWKGYRKGTKDPVQVYDLSKDPAEKNNVAENHPDVAKQIDSIMMREHIPSKHYFTREHAKDKKPNRPAKKGKKKNNKKQK